MKKLLSIFLITIFSTLTFAQTTAIPDAGFEQALIYLGIDTGVPNGSVPTSNISGITYLDISYINMNNFDLNLTITDITGIEDFNSLTYLDCRGADITSLNLTQNTALLTLKCWSSSITNIDLTQNVALTHLEINSCNLTSLDISQNINLTHLDCYSNMLSNLNLSQNIMLDWLHCGDNLLTNLDVSQNVNLINLRCGNNNLNVLDVSQNLNLTNLRCHNNQITSGLDLSQHTSLNFLQCENNLLYSLNVKNGNNINFYTFGFYASNNPNLTCIEVDDTSWATTNWSSRIDGIASFSTNCNNNAITTVLPTITICQGDSALIFGNYQNTSNNYYNLFNSVQGYDSIVTQPLIVTPVFLSNQVMRICNGDSLLIYGAYQNSAGTYYDSLQTANGCDSVLSTTLILDTISSYNQNQTICQGDSILIFGVYQNQSGVYYDTLQTANGCDSVLSIALVLDTISYYNQNQSICQGDSILIFSVYQNQSGIYYDTLQTVGGCDSILSVNLTIIPVNFSSNFTYIDNGNGNFSFTNTSTGSFNSSFWNFGDGNNSSQTNANHVYSSNSSYQVSLTVFSSNGCSNSFSQTINVSSVPCMTASFTHVNNGNNNVSFTNTSQLFGTPPYSYFWDFTIDTTSVQNPNFTYNFNGDWFATLTVTDSLGCSDSTTQLISVNSLPCNATFTYVDNGNGNFSFSSSPTGVSPIGYLWNFDDGTTGQGPNPTHTFTSIGTYAVGLFTQDFNLCETLDFDTIVVTNIGCNSLTSNFTYIDNGNGNYSFTNTSTGSFTQTHWAFGDGTTSTIVNPNHTFNANDTFVVVLTINDSNNTCTDYSLNMIVANGVINPVQCAAGFVMFPDTNGIIVINSSTGTNLTYLWDFGDGDTSNLQFPSHTYATSGSYYLCLTINDGASCVDMYCDSIGENGVVFSKQTGFTINVIAPPLTTQVKEHATLTSSVAIYPNPNNGSFEFGINAPFQQANLTILDITGKVIIQQKIMQNNTQLNLLSHPKGMYFYQLLVDGKQVTGKLIVQ